MINGNEYAWEDIQVNILGRLVEGITAVEYSTKRQHDNIYGRGNKPRAMGRGKKEFSGSITLLQSEVEAIQAALPKGKDLTDIAAFPIVVSYAPEAGGNITTDSILSARFTEVKKGGKQGDTSMPVELPLAIGDILYNV